MQLYTSLVRLKQSMNGGVLPPMMPVPDAVRWLIDPQFTPGLGALEEDPDRGLRCPIKQCGGYYHRLGNHIAGAHKWVTPEQVQQILDIPTTLSLVSSSEREKMRSRALTPRRKAVALENLERARRAPRKLKTGKGSRTTVHGRNLRDRCRAQVATKLLDLQNEIGRSPSLAEATAKLGAGVVDMICETWGSWNAAKASLGLDIYTTRHTPHRKQMVREAAIAGLAEWYRVHGELPSYRDAHRPARTPMIMSVGGILGVFETQSWVEAMRRVAAHLDIRGGRYGLPESA